MCLFPFPLQLALVDATFIPKIQIVLAQIAICLPPSHLTTTTLETDVGIQTYYMHPIKMCDYRV